MITTEIISDKALKITLPDKLNAADFGQIAPQIDSLISQHGQIRLLIDASGFMAGRISRRLKLMPDSSETTNRR